MKSVAVAGRATLPMQPIRRERTHMPALELDRTELDLLVEAVAAHLDRIDAAMEKAMAEGDRVTVTHLSKQAQWYNDLHSRLSPPQSQGA